MVAASVRGTEEAFYLIIRTEAGVETFTIPARDVVVKKSLLRIFTGKGKQSPEERALELVKPELRSRAHV